MTRRIFVVLWVVWAVLVALPIAGVSLYFRITHGFSLNEFLAAAAWMWAPFFLLVGLQYIVTGVASPLRMLFDEGQR